MTDRMDKILNRLSAKERTAILLIIKQILAGRFSHLDLKKLRGAKHIYRIRKGDFRIIFSMPDPTDIRVIAIERRSKTTYDIY